MFRHRTRLAVRPRRRPGIEGPASRVPEVACIWRPPGLLWPGGDVTCRQEGRPRGTGVSRRRHVHHGGAPAAGVPLGGPRRGPRRTARRGPPDGARPRVPSWSGERTRLPPRRARCRPCRASRPRRSPGRSGLPRPRRPDRDPRRRPRRLRAGRRRPARLDAPRRRGPVQSRRPRRPAAPRLRVHALDRRRRRPRAPRGEAGARRPPRRRRVHASAVRRGVPTRLPAGRRRGRRRRHGRRP